MTAGEDCQRHFRHPDSVPNHHRVIRELTEPSLEPDVTRGVGTVNIKLGAEPFRARLEGVLPKSECVCPGRRNVRTDDAFTEFKAFRWPNIAAPEDGRTPDHLGNTSLTLPPELTGGRSAGLRPGV